MATRQFLGNAPRIAQVTAWLFAGTWETSDVITVTPTGSTKVFTTTAGSTTVATLVESLKEALVALDATNWPEFAEVTWTRSGSSLVATSNTAGVPFTFTVATTETGGVPADAQTIDGVASSAGTNSTANSGPNVVNLAANWSGSAVPVNSDDVYIDGDVDLLYGLDNNTVTLTSLTIAGTFTGRIGLPERNGSGYDEYRETYLKISATTVNIGIGEGNGSGRIKLNTGSVQTTLNVHGMGSKVDAQAPHALLWIGTHNSNTVNLYRGSVGLAALPGEAATIATLRIGYDENQAGDVQVTVGVGVTLTTLVKNGGELLLLCAFTTATQKAGDTTFTGTSLNGTTLNVNDSGRWFHNATGTITTLNLSGDESVIFDASRDQRSKTITTANRYGRAQLLDPFKVLAFTNGIDLEQADLSGINLGTNINIQRAAVS